MAKRTSKALLDLAIPLADQLASALGVGCDGDERLTIALVIGNTEGGGWASCIRGDEDVARLMLRNASADAEVGGFDDRPVRRPASA